MSEHFPALLITTPLLAAFIVSALSWLKRSLCFPVALVALGVSAFSTINLLYRVVTTGPVDYFLGGWPPPVGIAYRVDYLNTLVLVVVSVAAFINLWSSRRLIEEEFSRKAGAFYTLYLLAVTGLLGVTVTGDAFNLYVLLEICSLTGYALIGIGQGRAPLSALQYLIVGSIGASFYLLGIGYLYIVTGTLNMADLARLLPPLFGNKAVLVAFGIAIVGLWLKMAFFPLHSWLPNAYTHAPSPSSSLLAPLMTKVMIYVMIRLMLTIFTLDYIVSLVTVQTFIMWLAVAAIVGGALMALSERKNLKRMLTYIVVSEVGYMVGGAWLGNQTGMTGAILHIVNDAVMTLCLFLTAGAIYYRQKDLSFESLKGLFGRMPWTSGALVMAAMAIIGVPPTCGFFSKWYLLRGALEAGEWPYLCALLFSSLVSVVLFFRIFEIAYYGWINPPAEEAGHGHGHGHHAAPAMAEAPASMLIPLYVATAGLFVLGFFAGDMVTMVISKAVGM